MKTSSDRVRIRLDFQRIQTYLFSVPRLKAMLGANARLGGLIRKELVETAKKYCCTDNSQSDGLLPFDPADPLTEALQKRIDRSHDASSTIWNDLRDDPRALRQQGIVSRDGGHFIVDIDEKKVDEFICEVDRLLLGYPGLVVQWKKFDETTGKYQFDDQRFLCPPKLGESPVLLPVFEVCEDTGREPASEKTKDKDNKEKSVSRQVSGLEESADKFYDNESHDLISCLARVLPGYDYDKTGMRKPIDLNDLAEASGGYLALISLDGNDIGKRFKEWQKDQNKAGQCSDSEIFFHSMRVAMRKAVVAAIKDAFGKPIEDAAERQGKVVIPYQLLMLGGDDLLLLCQPQYALRFVRALEDRLSANLNLADGLRMSFGAGVTIAKASLPFHRLIEAAESLQSSAKFLWRSQKKEGERFPERSTVDWAVTTATWFDDPIEARKRLEVRRYQDDNGKVETLCLTQKPLFVNSKDSDTEGCTLQSLNEAAAALKIKQESQNSDTTLARSQLRKLAGQLEQGRAWSEYLLSRMPKDLKDELKKEARITKDTLWLEKGEASGRYRTKFMDLVELMELSRLGAKTEKD